MLRPVPMWALGRPHLLRQFSWFLNPDVRDPVYIVVDPARDDPWIAHPAQYIQKIHPRVIYQQVFESRGAYVFRRVWPPTALASARPNAK